MDCNNSVERKLLWDVCHFHLLDLCPWESLQSSNEGGVEKATLKLFIIHIEKNWGGGNTKWGMMKEPHGFEQFFF